MCRKKQARGLGCLCFGLGLMTGYFLESWLLCSAGGFCLMIFGLVLFTRR